MNANRVEVSICANLSVAVAETRGNRTVSVAYRSPVTPTVPHFVVVSKIVDIFAINVSL